jgi:hypothetical protein
VKSSWITQFIDGLQSVISVTGAVKGVISSSVAEGVESGFNRITPGLINLSVISGLLFAGLLMLAFGLSVVIQNVIRVPGLGYLTTGVAFIAVAAIYCAFKQ